jgi:hypothetical protein
MRAPPATFALAALAALALAPVARAQADNAQVDVGTVEAPAWSMPDDLVIRARVAALDPPEPTSIQWRHGGEGMGGEVVRGALAPPGLPAAAPAPEAAAGARRAKAPALPTFQVGEWSAPVPLVEIRKAPWPRILFVTFWVGRPLKFNNPVDRVPVDFTKSATLEFEISQKGRIVRTFAEAAPDGNAVTLVVWPERWAGQEKPDHAAGFMGLLEYVTQRAALMEKSPWSKGELPRKFSLVTDFGGYGVVNNYGVHHSSRPVVDAEARTLRQLGVNGLRAAPGYFLEQAKKREGTGAAFDRVRIVQVPGYPVVPKPRVPDDSFEPGCPFGPKVPELTKVAVEKALADLRDNTAPEVWGLTVDEIGVVFDHTNQGKAHVEKCPRCVAEFVKFAKAAGRQPADFGKADWAEVRPLIISPKDPDPSWMQKPGAPMAAYETRRFIAHASAAMFTPLRDAVAAANRERAKAPAGSPAATQPAMCTYALRGNTFLLGGHSLDFFDFYRLSDNGFVYETSNRDSRVHPWDSYLCDVGRMVSAEQGLAFGVYVKPHRGAVVQRALTAISRGATMLFWYTYGPDYNKGDCFSSSAARLELTGKAARLIARAEDALYGAKWAQPARIGIVKPVTSEIWLGLSAKHPAWVASHENAKWAYTALAHEHLPVDPLDEKMLEERDLSQYRVLYVHGPNLRRTAAAKLAKWVEDGGTLYASGWSLARDEANQPLDLLLPALGLESRTPPEMYLALDSYNTGPLESFEPQDAKRGRLAEPPAGAAFKGAKPFEANFTPKVGREVLKPSANTEVLGRYADGAAAVTRHAHGKGQVFVVGLFPGLEYSAGVRNDEYDMGRQFDANLRRLVTSPALAAAQPVVDASAPTVEGVLLANPASGARSVALMNWTYRIAAVREQAQGRGVRRTPLPALVEQKGLQVAVRGAGPVQRVRSAMLDKELPFKQEGELLKVTLPELQEADVLLLE